MEPYIIGIDLGTGSVKAIAMNYRGEILGTSQVPYPTVHPQQGYHEQDPEVIWGAFVKCLSTATREANKAPDAIAFSSAMHSLIPVDKNGKALMNMMTWADNRSAPIATRIHRSATAEMLYEQTGTPIHAMSPLCKILWLKENEPDIFSRTFKFISIKEYIWYALSGRFEVDYSIASATGLMDIERLTWNENALDLAQIKSHQLSTLVNINHREICTDKTLCQTLGITDRTPFYAGASDGCLANVGSFASEAGVMALTIGTSGAVRVASKKPMQNFKAMTFNYRLDAESYICGGPTNNGGLVLKWYAENFTGNKLDTPSDYTALFETLEKSPPGAEGLIFLPYILGERAPIWRSDACGVFFGMHGYHQQPHFTRAVIEGISMALYHITCMMTETGLSIQQIHVSGGFVHAAEWLQILSNIFDKKICLINTADASAIGAAYVVLRDLGIINDYQQLKPKDITEFVPQREYCDLYQRQYERYRRLYDSVADQMTAA